VTARQARQILKKPYARVLVPDPKGGYAARMLEFPGCFAEGETAEEALRNLENAAESWIQACPSSNYPIPPPQMQY
jgi:predicted RNase H-like HicB family nuclease